jgi:hypothetical protein
MEVKTAAPVLSTDVGSQKAPTARFVAGSVQISGYPVSLTSLLLLTASAQNLYRLIPFFPYMVP